MKKLVALLLALALAFGIVPAGAEYIDVIYEREHPDEIANLDIDQLLAGWGYEDDNDMTARERFMEFYSKTDYTLEQVVKTQYIGNRIDVQHCLESLPAGQAEYPELWASFDADTWFEQHIRRDVKDERRSKEAYMAYHNILTEEEFVAYIFDACVFLHWAQTWEQERAVEIEDIELYLDGKRLELDVPPEVKNQRTMVPVRAVAEAIGADVEWMQETQQAVLTRAGSTITMTIGSTTADIDGKQVEMDVAPYAVNGRTLLPARYVAEFFGQTVVWDGEKRWALITEDKSVAGDSNLEAWALAMGAMRGYMDKDSPNVFGQMRRSSSATKEIRERLASAWGSGSSREGLIALIQSMTPHGHNDDFQEAAAIANSLTEEEMAYLISVSSETDQYMWSYTKSLSEKWGEKGILAWDLSRMANLAQWGYTAGFLTYEEALELIEPAARMAHETFSSWEEFYENYLDGYNWWARNNVLEKNLWTVTRGPTCRDMLDDPSMQTILDDALFETGVIGLPEE